MAQATRPWGPWSFLVMLRGQVVSEVIAGDTDQQLLPGAQKARCGCGGEGDAEQGLREQSCVGQGPRRRQPRSPSRSSQRCGVGWGARKPLVSPCRQLGSGRGQGSALRRGRMGGGNKATLSLDSCSPVLLVVEPGKCSGNNSTWMFRAGKGGRDCSGPAWRRFPLVLVF